MRLRILLSVLIVCALAASLAAQTKFSTTLQCAKADPVYTIPIGDQPGHAFAISKARCTWAPPMEIAGVAAKELELTAFREISGDRWRGRAIGVATFANGDRYFSSSQSSGTISEGVPQSVEGAWSYNGGTGKLKGLKGKGALKGKAAPDGTISYQIEGEYQLP